MVAVGFSPRINQQRATRRGATHEGSKATVAPRREACESPPWAEAHGYLHGVAPRLPDLSGCSFNETALELDEQFERAADEVFAPLGGAAFFPGLPDGFVRIDLFVAEGDEREDGVVDLHFLGARGVRGAGGFPCGGDAEFVFEFDDDALGGFFPDAFGLGEERGVAGDDGGFEGADGGAAEDIKGGLRADAADVSDEQSEEIALGGRHEAVKDVRVFADLEVC